ncbi:MAG: phosphoribosylaminoimidazolesuccinocarboxamide synthase, partial [Thermodesulfovibrionales bacterium]
MEKVVLETSFPDLKLVRRGKVRDIYDLGEHLLLVVTDRVSAFDVILPNGIPGKGKVLTRISLFWFALMSDLVENHVVASEVDDYPGVCHKHREFLEGRSILVKKASPLPVECIVRGYLSGSGWREYRSEGSVCGIRLPGGLRESERLPEPLFTPSTKAEQGHDINITFDEVTRLLGQGRAQQVRDLSLRIYLRAVEWALKKGIIIADTKFEFGEY